MDVRQALPRRGATQQARRALSTFGAQYFPSRYCRNMTIGRGWFGALYAAFFILWGAYQIVEHPYRLSRALGAFLLLVGLVSGAMWLRNWRNARRSP